MQNSRYTIEDRIINYISKMVALTIGQIWVKVIISCLAGLISLFSIQSTLRFIRNLLEQRT